MEGDEFRALVGELGEQLVSVGIEN